MDAKGLLDKKLKQFEEFSTGKIAIRPDVEALKLLVELNKLDELKSIKEELIKINQNLTLLGN